MIVGISRMVLIRMEHDGLNVKWYLEHQEMMNVISLLRRVRFTFVLEGIIINTNMNCAINTARQRNMSRSQRSRRKRVVRNK